MPARPASHPVRAARLLAGLATTLLASGAVQAQTCSGVLWMEFYDVTSETRPAGRYVIPLQTLGIVAEYYHGEAAGTPTAEEAGRDPALALRDREEIRAFSRLYAGGTELGVAPHCNLALLHLEITYRHETMTLDVYRVPDHIGLRLDGPIPFRPGRYVLDLSTAERRASDGSGHVYAADAIRPADAPAPGRD